MNLRNLILIGFLIFATFNIEAGDRTTIDEREIGIHIGACVVIRMTQLDILYKDAERYCSCVADMLMKVHGENAFNKNRNTPDLDEVVYRTCGR